MICSYCFFFLLEQRKSTPTAHADHKQDYATNSITFHLKFMSDKSQTLEFKPRTNSEHERTRALWDIQVTQIEKVHDPQIKKRNEEK